MTDFEFLVKRHGSTVRAVVANVICELLCYSLPERTPILTSSVTAFDRLNLREEKALSEKLGATTAEG